MCAKGHEWETVITERSNGTNCPFKKKKKQTSFAEQAIYFYCSKFTKAINRYTKFGKEIDIYLPEYKIGIEYNGKYWHKNKEQQDREKVKYFADKGIRIITVKEGYRNFIENDIIEHNSKNKETINFVIEAILKLIDIKDTKPDIVKEESKILEQYIESEKENSVASKYPKSIKEWNYEKNGKVLPTMVAHRSHKSVW